MFNCLILYVPKNKTNPGKIIKNYRVAKGLTQREMGVLLGVTLEQYQRYESWNTPAPYERLEKIIQILEIPPHKLFNTGKITDFAEQFERKIKKYSKIFKLLEDDPRLIAMIKAYKKRK